MKRDLFKLAKKFLPLIGIVILIYLILGLDLEKVKDAFLSIKPIYILLSLSLTVPALIVRIYAWQYIQKEQKIKLSYFKSLKFFMIGSFYSTITPGFVGHLIRVPYMKEETGEPYGKLFVNITIDVIIRTLAVFLMMMVGTLLVIGRFSQLFPIVMVVFAVYGFAMLFFIKKERGEKLFHKIIKYIIPEKFKGDSYKFVNTFYTDFPKIRRLVFPLFLSIIVWIIVFTQEYITVIALGAGIPYLYFLLLYPIANTAGYLPLTVAGLGLREFTAIMLFSTLFGAQKEEILVVALVGFLITDVFLGVIGFLVSLIDSRETSEKKKEMLRFQ